ncbi:SagB family peptide dehydrogenase [Desmospora activa]|uniref:SagB-type dehydrogenase family enzyme n=1 Tax=Desmospora activa DSM 45169 TaxID=1121389 RepID=A0A2T4ZAX9_9BACL|nr:SagB family peptide dehydrogenase [Desmospora activa]PTM59042.1 SagB-type dehydrogenase family enzyme [Desmospora activa DSM 45169]
MSLALFLHQLHREIEKLQPPDWEVDWDDAPHPYKLYRGLPVVPLSAEVPLTLRESKVPQEPDLQDIGHFLWYVYGLTQYSPSIDSDAFSQAQRMRRFVPSGGALYPNEFYVYLKVKGLPVGMYHYDVAHHRLVLLREGNIDTYLAQALGDRCQVSACFGTVFVSTLFWKNFFKYNNFSYRLQGLDAGVLIGQLLEVGKRFGFSAGIYFRFLDRAVNHLLGLDETEESVYAVIPLTIQPAITWFADHTGERISASQLCRELPEIHHHYVQRSHRVKAYPRLIEINEASMLETLSPFNGVETKRGIETEGEKIPLPTADRLTYDLAEVCRKRVSPGLDFVFQKKDREQLAALLFEVTASLPYRNDLDEGRENPDFRLSLLGCFYGVEGVAKGAYHYDHTSHSLHRIRSGDYRYPLQQGMSFPTVNLLQVPFCLHIAGEQDHYLPQLGYRGYRIQQMEAGILLQRLLLTAGALGMGGHPLLGFDGSRCDQLYKLAPQKKTTLIQIPVGPYRIRPRLGGGLHC